MLIGSDGAYFKNEIINLMENMPVNASLKNELISEIENINQESGNTKEAWSSIFYWDKNFLGSVDARTYHVLTLLYDSIILEESKSLIFTKE